MNLRSIETPLSLSSERRNQKNAHLRRRRADATTALSASGAPRARTWAVQVVVLETYIFSQLLSKLASVRSRLSLCEVCRGEMIRDVIHADFFFCITAEHGRLDVIHPLYPKNEHSPVFDKPKATKSPIKYVLALTQELRYRNSPRQSLSSDRKKET